MILKVDFSETLRRAEKMANDTGSLVIVPEGVDHYGFLNGGSPQATAFHKKAQEVWKPSAPRPPSEDELYQVYIDFTYYEPPPRRFYTFYNNPGVDDAIDVESKPVKSETFITNECSKQKLIGHLKKEIAKTKQVPPVPGP